MITLSMIVKNEAHCLARCLASVRGSVDLACIVDTGSSDGTKRVIAETLDNVPHIIHDRPWADFSTNRNEALQLAYQWASGGYALVMDADETLHVDEAWHKQLDLCGYAVWQEDGDGFRYLSPRVLRLNSGWAYEGAMHETVICTGPDLTRGLLPGIVKGHFDSARNKQGVRVKSLADAAVLRAQPKTPRNVFYLGQTLVNAEEYEQALAVFEERADMEGFVEETWQAQLMVAKLRELLQYPPSKVAVSYQQAHEFRPQRAEASWHLARFLKATGHRRAEQFASIAASLPMTTDQQFIEMACYGQQAPVCANSSFTID